MKSFLPFAILCLLGFYSCSSHDDFPENEKTPVSHRVLHNQWTYAQMNHSYYWRKDMPDSLSMNYELEPATFFRTLLSPKDRFSYCDFNKNFTGEELESLYDMLDKAGFEYQPYRDSSGKLIVRVLYVTKPDVSKNGIERGDWLMPIGRTYHTIQFRKGGINENCEFIPSDSLSLSILPDTDTFNPSVYMDSVYMIAGKRIGYLVYLQYDNPTDLIASFKKFKEAHLDELILDLRYNPGGFVTTCNRLCNLIIAEQYFGEVFQYRRFNERLAAQYVKETGDSMETSFFQKEPVVGKYNLNLDRLTVLTSRYTASASEATILCLRPFVRVTLIGEQTVGKGVGSWAIADKRFNYYLQPITSRYYNSEMISTPDEGLLPDYYIPEGYEVNKKKLGNREEPLLNKALELLTRKELKQHVSPKKTSLKELSLIPSKIKVAGMASFEWKMKKQVVNEYHKIIKQ